MGIAVLGMDLGKNVCSLVGIVAMQDLLWSPSSRSVVRRARTRVRLMSPEYVRPYVKAQKNDDRDAEGIAEAATRPTMRFVDLKSERSSTCRRCTGRAIDRWANERC